MAAIRPPGRFPPASRAGMRAPVERLASLKNPNPTPIRRPQPVPAPQPKSTNSCPNPGCPAPNIVEDDGQRVCSGCGTVISESNIVSEITFGESSSGAAIVQGTFVGADQSHGRSFGPGFQRGGGMESREITEQNGNRYIAQFSRALNVPESATKAAGQVFKLAVGLNFIQGRRTKTVAAICLYVACRRQDGNTVMLIDFADILMINVFKLGRIYKALLDELRLEGNMFNMNPIDPESLIYRFAKQLEFGTSMMQVASEAVRIVQRMNRDWMVTGRRPAGICGAALILAARMNNFRRTVREMVYVVKVTEITIHQRLNEFKATESGDLTVDQFRSVQLENAHDPPSFTRGKEPKKAGRGKKRKAPETAAEIEDDDDLEDETPEPQIKKSKRVDADGFVIPDIPIDPALLADVSEVSAALVNGTEEEKTKRGRPKTPKGFQPPPPTESELASESALESEMTELLSSSSNLLVTTTPPTAPTTSSNGPTSSPPVPEKRVPKPIPESEEIGDDEFDSDPEVRYCLLSPAEVEIKERIWVHENKDYLRTQQAKAIKRALAEEESPGHVPRRPRKRRKGRMGDIRYLEGGEGEGEGDGDGKTSTRASTPAEATRRMLERRGFSKKINYRLLEEMYEDGTDKEAKEAAAKERGDSEMRSRSRSQSVRSRSVSVFSERSVRRERMVKSSRTPAPMSIPVSTAAAAGAGARVPAKSTKAPPPPTTPAAAPAPAPPEEPTLVEHPVDPNEEILGYIPEPEPMAKNVDGEDFDEEEEEDEEAEDYEEDDRLDDAFAGEYYDEGSEGGYDDEY
ncbi:hypothetical protein AJ80_08228 [Polytolypa hystricis UAMH7299]|uniref:B-related factor 1 n=1 Tax=Polytolypa hystricis (strain UAMH7299) TaxID=1447883 RepID=A0A2B7XB01_POLH7|nr:hypothetical protein AJ80_08228 [Polytolypa hystricis UAMH7299]